MIIYDIDDRYIKHMFASKGSRVMYLNPTFQLRSTNFKVALDRLGQFCIFKLNQDVRIYIDVM